MSSHVQVGQNLRRVVTAISILMAAAPLAAHSETPLSGSSQPVVFATQFASWGALPATLARIVYFRDISSPSERHAANVYMDGRFHTALHAGNFTVFCLTPGAHILSSYVREAPFYPGKRATLAAMNITGGTTYYLKVDEEHIGGGNTGVPIPVAAGEALAVLADKHEQDQVLSRAATVACPSPSTARS